MWLICIVSFSSLCNSWFILLRSSTSLFLYSDSDSCFFKSSTDLIAIPNLTAKSSFYLYTCATFVFSYSSSCLHATSASRFSFSPLHPNLTATSGSI